MNRSRTSYGTILYIVIGIIVAANHGYFANLNTISGILSALLAVILWPLLFFGVNVHLSIS